MPLHDIIITRSNDHLPTFKTFWSFENEVFLFLSTILKSVSVLVHHIERNKILIRLQNPIEITGYRWNCRFEAMLSQIGEPTTLEKMDIRSWVGVGKIGRDSAQCVECNVHNWHPGEKWFEEHGQTSAEVWEIHKLLSKLKSVDLFWHRLCGPAVGRDIKPAGHSGGTTRAATCVCQRVARAFAS